MFRKLLLLLLCMALACPAQAQTAPDAFFDQMYEQLSPRALVVLVWQQGEEKYQYARGFQDAGSTRPADENTLFKCASVTKMVTAVGLMQLWEQGEFLLDTPLEAYYGKPVCNPLRQNAPVTLRQVMSHTSSIRESAGYNPRWGDEEQAESYFLRASPGKNYQYANLNGGLTGSAVELFSRQSLQSYMHAQVFAPLFLDAAYSPVFLNHPENMADTFRTNGDVYMTAAEYLQEASPYDDTCAPHSHYRTAVGSLWMSAHDMAVLGSMLSMGGSWQETSILSGDTVRLMCRDQSSVAGSSVTAESPYGLMVHILRDERLPDTWYGHQGAWEGLLCDVYFEDATDTVAVLIANGCAHPRTEGEVADLFIRTLQFVTETWIDGLIVEAP